MKKLLFLTLLIGFIACSKSGTDTDGSGDPDPEPNGEQTSLGKGQPGIVGMSGIEAGTNSLQRRKQR